MFKNYFKTAWRNLSKNRFYSLINISGLTVGLAVGILILLWVQDELSFDNFHKQAPDICRLECLVGTGTSKQVWTVTTASIGVMGKRELPEIKAAVRITGNYTYSLFKYGEKVFTEEASAFTDPSFFTVFDFPLIRGNAANPFPDNNSVVLTTSTAKRYFGEQDPIGKVLTADGTTSFTVSGVIPDFPKNSSIRYDLLLPMSLLKQMGSRQSPAYDMDNNFTQFSFETYLLLQPGTSLKTVADKLLKIHLRNKPDDTDLTYLTEPLTKMHLYNADGTDGGMGTVRMFIIIAILILVIACINNVNLSTARSMLRAKEVSLRKIVGATRFHLFMQFVVETALIFFLATVLAIGLMYILMPYYNQVSGKELVLNLSSYHIWLVILITISCTLLASSVYPAMLLSSFEPLKALKGKIAGGIGDAAFRKVLVVTQFVCSIVLIAGTFIISNQLKYIKSKELGYDKNYVFGFYMRDMSRHYDAIRADLMSRPGVADVTRGSENIINMGRVTGDTDWDGKGKEETFIVHPVAIDKDFIPFFKMKLVQGENFTNAPADSLHYIMNETAVRNLGMKDPIGKRFKMHGINGTISGVVKDFHYTSMKDKIGPVVFYYHEGNAGRIFIRTTAKDATKAIHAAEQEWKKYNPAFPFQYHFMDETFNEMYTSEIHTGLLFNIFAAIAILISCLGLFGLAAYTAQLRTREIGVRKVLGATVSGIIQLLATDFIRLVLIAIVIAIPIAWFAMDKWLQHFAYRTDIHWTVFALSGLLAILISIFTISFQSVKAALANPVKSLRTE
ncbi:ABC transporter permease [Chitinophaga sp. MM2321]|uniref:ABC transporter permease n=1 Tax=Chitinophaga sp. MM2321 TaxID=3137178 RepID=UPI0032D573CE